MRPIIHLLLGLGLLLNTGSAVAADQCPLLRQQQSAAEVATRIAAAACEEHLHWQRPFITADGRIASGKVWEGEASGLETGGSPWRQVARYWQEAGLLERTHAAGAGDCEYAVRSPGYPGLGCRGFVIDTPWSAAFISWLMQRAGVPGFRASAGHFDYVRAARRDPAGSPYLFQDPAHATPAVGDMLCYVRTQQVLGHAGLTALIDGGATGLNMHCDVVTAVSPGGDGKAYLVGGNVQQAVTMRVLNLNAAGRFWGLPQRTEHDPACSPEVPAACDFNRQDWAALLKLKPQAELAALGPVAPPRWSPAAPAQPPAQTCCINCVLGSGVPRCPPVGEQPASNDPAGGD